ncbi:MAG: hypothetical protein AB1918_14045 [Pseudomonadota bacterium]
MTFRLPALALALALPACAATSVPWQNPSVPEAQWSRDWTSCRRWAENQIGYRESDSPTFRDYDRANAKRQADALAGSCMRDRGYVPAPRRK